MKIGFVQKKIGFSKWRKVGMQIRSRTVNRVNGIISLECLLLLTCRGFFGKIRKFLKKEKVTLAEEFFPQKLSF